jgi:hypothetical protein
MKRLFTFLFLLIFSVTFSGCDNQTIVENNTPPEIIGNESFDISVFDTTFDIKDEFYLVDDYDGVFLLQDEDIDYQDFNITKIGSYPVLLTVKDSGNATSTKQVILNVLDTKRPSIELLGVDTVIVLKDNSYTEAGVLVNDNYDQELEVITIGEVDGSVTGEYILEYYTVDSSNNRSISIYRTVVVAEQTDVLALSGSATSETIDFDINILNEALFDKITSIQLEQNGTVIKTLSNFTNLSFTGLTENTHYDVVVTYSYFISGSNETFYGELTYGFTTTSLYELDQDGLYTSKDDVALYLTLYNELPSNFMTKSEAGDHISSIWTVQNQASIGGDYFGNREGLLPTKNGRQYYEVDINYHGGSRNAERIVYSNDGFIFYTSDHYESFVLYDKDTRTWNHYTLNDEIFD